MSPLTNLDNILQVPWIGDGVQPWNMVFVVLCHRSDGVLYSVVYARAQTVYGNLGHIPR